MWDMLSIGQLSHKKNSRQAAEPLSWIDIKT